MTTHQNNAITKIDSFWEKMFNPTGDDLIRVNSHLLASRYLKQIEEVLENKKMTQKDLAIKIKISPSYLSQLFCGNKLPSWKTLAKIELALNIKFELMPNSNVNNKYIPNLRSKQEKRIFGMFKGQLGGLEDVDWFKEDEDLSASFENSSIFPSK